ncbi:choice-of-anchor B family protein [Pontibacter sp. G13]|uniref:choice-of-anchor B family protein n=1 Tax=Pontibacter sp. G13 TaxID=3074898 RepID=UPI00288B2029|nr:choice-of-anchor B family protein [Pontibacter sp. G13]WNJ17731.1 choice-of-anchor B family protein [Pontibacter sp. G13]
MKYFYSLMAALLISLSGGMAQVVKKNLDLVGELGYDPNLSDIWGYVDGTGREYALVGATNGVSIVDLDDPSNPQELFFIPGAETIWRDLKTFGDYAYVSNEGGNGLLVIDLSGLPGSIQHKDTVIAGTSTIHNLWVDDAGYLYFCGGNTFNGGMVILDLNPNPWTPDFVGAYDDAYVHDVYVRNDTAYLAEINIGFLTIVDVADKSDLEVLGTRTYVDAFTHNTWLNDAGNVVFTTDELSEAYIYSFDVSDPSDPVILDRIRSNLSGGTTIPHNVHVQDDYLVISYYRDGIYVVDAARPHNMVEVGYYDTSPFSGDGFNGSWGAYPFLPSGLVLASDMEQGLVVLDPTYIRACYLEGDITDANTGNSISGANVEILGTDAFEMSSNLGAYATGIADAGTYQVVYSKYGYYPDTLTVSLSNGVLTEEDVALVPRQKMDLTIVVTDAETGNPIPLAKLSMRNPEVTFDYLTDATGSVLATDFTPGDFELIVGNWGYLAQSISLMLGDNDTTITVALESGYRDEFALDLGWIVFGDAERGIWERGEPVGTYLNGGFPFAPEFDLADDIGNMAYVTGNGGGNVWTDDVDNGTTSLLSPSILVADYEEPMLRFHYGFANTTTSNTPGDDSLVVTVSNFMESADVFFTASSYDSVWVLVDSIPLKDYISTNVPFQITFRTADVGSGNWVEASIDGVEVFDAAADTSGTTSIDYADFQSVNIWSDPSGGQFWISRDLAELNPTQAWEVNLYDLRGAALGKWEIPAGEARMGFPLPDTQGMYVVSVSVAGQRVKSEKIIR